MLLTLTRPRPIYTLHTSSNTIMAWNHGKSVVAFYNEKDIRRFGNLIESHYENAKEWPDFSTLTMSANPKRDGDLMYSGIFEWESIDNLKDFCSQHFFNVITIDQFTNDYELKGFTIEIEPIINLDYLTYLFNGGETGPWDNSL